MNTEKPDALRLADWHKAMADEPKRNEAKRDKHRRTDAELRRLYAENQQLMEQSLEEAKINGAGAERELKLMAELDKVKQITLRDEALLRIAYLAIDKMLPTAWCEEGDVALNELKERLK